jgi:hypothetical protein
MGIVLIRPGIVTLLGLIVYVFTSLALKISGIFGNSPAVGKCRAGYDAG